MFSNQRLDTYKWQDQNAQVLDPEGLVDMYLGAQDLTHSQKKYAR